MVSRPLCRALRRSRSWLEEQNNASLSVTTAPDPPPIHTVSTVAAPSLASDTAPASTVPLVPSTRSNAWFGACALGSYSRGARFSAWSTTDILGAYSSSATGTLGAWLRSAWSNARSSACIIGARHRSSRFSELSGSHAVVCASVRSGRHVGYCLRSSFTSKDSFRVLSCAWTLRSGSLRSSPRSSDNVRPFRGCNDGKPVAHVGLVRAPLASHCSSRCLSCTRRGEHRPSRRTPGAFARFGSGLRSAEYCPTCRAHGIFARLCTGLSVARECPSWVSTQPSKMENRRI